MIFKQNKPLKTLGIALLTLCLVFSAVLGLYDRFLPHRVSLHAGEAMPEYCFAKVDESGAVTAFSAEATPIVTTRATYKLFGILPLRSVRVSSYDTLTLYPGGMPFGVKFFTEGVAVVGFGDIRAENGKNVNPAYEAGIRLGDKITKLNGRPLNSAEELTRIIDESGGRSVEITYRRGTNEYKTTISPLFSESEGKYKTGMWVRDSGAGIGTVTFIVPESDAFAGLGHGICDAEDGSLVPIKSGHVVGVRVSGIVKGLAGSPGEIRGYFNSGKTGTLLGNSDCGVWGLFNEIPTPAFTEPLPIGLRHELCEGVAHIYCTLDSNTIEKYEIRISDIDRNADGNKCFTIKVTDPALLEKSGGIIQGMSGSPIVQNGKLVGAVTHVLIGDPATGYGIFIENMLDQMGDLLG